MRKKLKQLYERYENSTPSKKLGAWGSTASIIGLMLALLIGFNSSNKNGVPLPGFSGDTPGTQKPGDTGYTPPVPEERKREIVFLANELENFKNQMQRMKSTLPDKYYDKRDSKEKYPKKDQRIIDISTYNRYKTFQTPSGVPDFSNLTNNDIVLLCTTFKSESDAYYLFYRDYGRIFGLKTYKISPEVTRICQSVTRGR